MLRFPAACILALLAAAPANATELPRIAVVGVHQAELTAPDQERAVAGLVAAIEATGRFDALTPGEVAGTILGREKVILEEGLLASGRQNLLNGKNSFNQASPDDAIAYLETAIQDFRNSITATNTVDDLWEAWLYLGTATLQRDPPDEAAARAAFKNMIALTPARAVNPALFPPNVIETITSVRDELAATPVRLEIATDAEASIYVDGLSKGKSPLTVEGLLPGEHHVVAIGAGTQGYAKVDVLVPVVTPPVEGTPVVPASQSVRVRMDPPRLGDSSASPVGRSNQVSAVYNALGNRADGLDYVLVVGVDGSVLYVQLLDPKTDTFTKAVEIPFADMADDEAIQTVPLMLNFVGKDGQFTATSATSAPIHVGGNSELALLLTQPRAPTPIGVNGNNGNTTIDDGKKSKLPLILGITGGVIAAGAGSYAVYALTKPEQAPPNQGTIVIVF